MTDRSDGRVMRAMRDFNLGGLLGGHSGVSLAKCIMGPAFREDSLFSRTELSDTIRHANSVSDQIRRLSGTLDLNNSRMALNVHNPDQYMSSLRQILAQGRKRIGLLVGAGAPAGIFDVTGKHPLIPAVAGLTVQVLNALKKDHGTCLDLIQKSISNPNIESILSRVRGLASVIGTAEVHGLNGDGHAKLSEAICKQIGTIVHQPLPTGESAFTQLVSWMSGSTREHGIEIFTTNYDLLFEQALERGKLPYFDGFTGSHEPFFDPASISGDKLPSSWVRLCKLHGAIGWETNSNGEVIRNGRGSSSQLVYPEQMKYDRTQKAPYAALFDRLRSFLMTPDTLLISTGFSYADAHVSALIDECLAANPSMSLFAFQFQPIANEPHACDIGKRRPNMSVYCPDAAMVNGVQAPWKPGDPPSKDWGPIQEGYWDKATERFRLGQFDVLAKFFASSRSDQTTPGVAMPIYGGPAAA